MSNRLTGFHAGDHGPVENVDDLEAFSADRYRDRLLIAAAFAAALDVSHHGNRGVLHRGANSTLLPDRRAVGWEGILQESENSGTETGTETETE